MFNFFNKSNISEIPFDKLMYESERAQRQMESEVFKDEVQRQLPYLLDAVELLLAKEENKDILEEVEKRQQYRDEQYFEEYKKKVENYKKMLSGGGDNIE